MKQTKIEFRDTVTKSVAKELDEDDLKLALEQTILDFINGDFKSITISSNYLKKEDIYEYKVECKYASEKEINPNSNKSLITNEN